MSYVALAVEYHTSQESKKHQYIKKFNSEAIQLKLGEGSLMARISNGSSKGEFTELHPVQKEELENDFNLTFDGVKNNKVNNPSDQHFSMWLFFGITAIFALIIGFLQAPECSAVEDEEKEDGQTAEVEALLPSSGGPKDDGFRTLQVWYLTAW